MGGGEEMEFFNKKLILQNSSTSLTVLGVFTRTKATSSSIGCPGLLRNFDLATWCQVSASHHGPLNTETHMLLKAVLLGRHLHITKLGHSGPQVLYADPKEIFTGDFTSSSLCQDDKKERKKTNKITNQHSWSFLPQNILLYHTHPAYWYWNHGSENHIYETKGCINKALQKCRIQLLNSTTPIMNQRPR